MIVKCNACETSFQLDESRIPEKGIRVRCSRCKEAFFLPHPDAAPEPEAAAGDEAHEQRARALEESFNRDPSDAADAAVGDDPEDDANDISFEDFDDEESDWEFNGALPGEAPEPDPVAGGGGPTEAPEPLQDVPDLDGAATDPGIDFALAEDTEEPPVDVAPDPDEASARDLAADTDADLAIGSPDDFSDLAEEDPDTIPQLGLEPGSERDALLGAEAPSLASEADAASGLGEPEEWDFFGDDDGEAAFGELPPAEDAAFDAPPARTEALDGPDIDAVVGMIARPATQLQRFARLAGHAAGWSVFALLVCAGLSRALWPPEPSLASGTLVGSVRAVGVQGHWIDTAQNGRLYAVSGLLQSADRSRSAKPPPLEVALVGNGPGSVLAQTVVGVELDDPQLRELSAGVLAQERRRATQQLLAARVRPGEGLPFMAIFDRVPGEALRFEFRPAAPETLEAAGVVAPRLERGALPLATREGQAGGGATARPLEAIDPAAAAKSSASERDEASPGAAPTPSATPLVDGSHASKEIEAGTAEGYARPGEAGAAPSADAARAASPAAPAPR